MNVEFYNVTFFWGGVHTFTFRLQKCKSATFPLHETVVKTQQLF